MKKPLWTLRIALSALALSGAASATEYSPWFGPVLEIEGRATAYVVTYPSIEASERSPYQNFPVDRHDIREVSSSTNGFLDLSASIAPTEDISAELELVLADTQHRNFGVDSILLTGRYRLWNDIVGDPLSLSIGIQAIDVFKPAWHDLSVFHHGGIACEAHVAAGKEFECMQFWTTRIWGVGAIGIGDVGSPWVKGDLVWDHNWWDLHEVRLFAHTLWGLGGDRLNLTQPFKGYGSIRHQSVDIGARYSYFMECGLWVKFEYAYRVFARNCPEKASIVTLGIQYNFGL